MLLRRYPPGSRRNGSKLFLESNPLTPILKKLEATGYIRRDRDPAD